MKHPLATYLQDHLGGAKAAVDLLGFLAKQHEDAPLGSFAVQLREEVEEDRKALRDLLDRIEGDRSHPLKEGAAWAGEKATRVKLNRHAGGGLGTLEALEAVGLGILGKLSLWRALAQVAPSDERLSDVDFDRLAERAVEQQARVEERRLELARTVLVPRADGAA